MNKAALRRFLKYSLVGVSTFALDLLLLFVFVEFFSWNYLIAAGAAFCIAVSVNYVISRRFVFTGTSRPLGEGYVWFCIIAATGLATITFFMFVFVELFHWNYLLSRIVIAAMVGIWGYLMNLYFNFKVAGKY